MNDMEAFKVYLPSNACHLIYPDNHPSNYRTRLDRLIQLDGEWEVGVESIFYSSHIEDKNKKEREIEGQQQLFLLSNIAKPTAYGRYHLQILQSFLHHPKKGDFIEKQFYPIVYLPLMTNNIDMIELQLTKEDYNPVKTYDFKTLVCLYFRKVRENSMM